MSVIRFTRRRPCPVCGGGDDDPRGEAKRCYGFLSDDGRYAHCTREPVPSRSQEDGDTWPHLIGGSCECGQAHTDATGQGVANGASELVIAATYDYRDAEGHLLYQVLRTAPKGFRQRRPKPGGGPDEWIWHVRCEKRQPADCRADGHEPLPPAPEVFYRMPELMAADPAGVVFFPEGEKDVEALREVGLTATCNVGGAGKWRRGTGANLSALEGRRVIVIADADEAGRQHARQVAGILRATAVSVETLELPGAKDASDWLTQGHTGAELDQLAEKTFDPVPEPLPEETDEGGGPQPAEKPAPAFFRRPAEVLAEIPLPKARLATGFPAIDKASRGGLPTGSLTVIQGGPDAGKTGMAIQVPIHMALHVTEDERAIAFFYMPDCGREVTAVRIGALLGFSTEALEQRDKKEVGAFDRALSDRGVFIFDDSLEELNLERAIAEAEKVKPELPHVLVTDSIQEAVPSEEVNDERARVIANVRTLRRAKNSRVPWILIATSEIIKSAYSSKRHSDDGAPIAAGSESAKIGYSANLMIHLTGDPAVGPDYGSARVVKNKLGGPKEAFGLRLDPATLKLHELDRQAVEDAKTETAERQTRQADATMDDAIFRFLGERDRVSHNEIDSSVPGRRVAKKAALDRLMRNGRVTCTEGPRGSNLYARVGQPHLKVIE